MAKNLLTGYFDQVQAKLDLTKTVIGEVWDTFPQMTETRVRNALAAFLFKGEEVYRPLSVCSGGERARVALLKLMLGGYNFLLLDEPTNHLDAPHGKNWKTRRFIMTAPCSLCPTTDILSISWRPGCWS